MAEILIDDLELSVRSINCLRNAGIVTVQGIYDYGLQNLSNIKHLGRRSEREICEVLDDLTDRRQEEERAQKKREFLAFCFKHRLVIEALRDGRATVNFSLKETDE